MSSGFRCNISSYLGFQPALQISHLLDFRLVHVYIHSLLILFLLRSPTNTNSKGSEIKSDSVSQFYPYVKISVVDSNTNTHIFTFLTHESLSQLWFSDSPERHWARVHSKLWVTFRFAPQAFIFPPGATVTKLLGICLSCSREKGHERMRRSQEQKVLIYKPPYWHYPSKCMASINGMEL